VIFVDKFSGDSVAWYNEGRVSPGGNSGSSIRWRKGDGNAYDGRFAGTCLYFPDLNGDGRADLHQIRGTFLFPRLLVLEGGVPLPAPSCPDHKYYN